VHRVTDGNSEGAIAALDGETSLFRGISEQDVAEIVLCATDHLGTTA
jgi:hypothetical protein